MALIITNPTGEGYNLDAQQRYFLYGGNDCLGTRQCWDVLYPQLVGDDLTLYRAAFAFQAPCLAMTLRGVRIDEPQRRLLTAACEREETAAVAALNANPQLQEMWDVLGKRPDSKCAKHPSGKLHQWLPRGAEPRDQFCKHCGGPRLVGTEFNPHSSTQCAHLLYDLLGLKRRWSKQRDAAGRRHLTTDDEALEAIALHDPEVAGLIDLILVARGLRKQLGVLRARLDPDGRWRATFNVCAASTGRMSSSKSPYRSGGNMQNVADKNRGMFTADPGLQLFYADMEAAESTLVAWDAECPQDIKDHENGDAHTGLAQTIFPDLDWGAAGGDPKLLRAIAEQRPPWGSDGSQVSSYRQVAKVTRHGCLHPDMEVLTQAGWCRVGDEPSALVAVWSPTGMLWERPTWHRVEVAEDLVCAAGRNYSQLTTADHRIAVKNNGVWGEKAAGSFAWSYGELPVAGNLDAGHDVRVADARVLAMVWADGSNSLGYTVLTLKKQRKVQRCRELLQAAELPFAERGGAAGSAGYRRYTQFYIRGPGLLRKELDWDLLSWSLPARQAFLSELVHWDGCASGGRVRILNTHLDELRIIQTLAHISGQAATINAAGKPRPNEVQCYCLSLSLRQTTSAHSVAVSALPYKGTVYCLRDTSTGYFLVRHKGIISVTGNTNIGMSAVGIARQLHSSRKLGAEMRERYFARYPENLARQLEIRGRVRDSGVLVGPLGNTRRFLGRLWEDDIQREALAQTQQSTVAWMLGLAVWRIWYELDTRLNIASTPRPSDPNRVWLLGPIHDAVVGLVRPDDDAALARVKEIMECPIVVHRKLLRIRCEIQVGPNWGHAALKKWLGPRAAERIKQEGTIQ